MSNPKPPIKAIFTDLDGTLLDPDHRLSDAALDTLARIRREYHNEIPFIVATGRPYGDVFRTLKDCQLEPDYIITSNGARIHDRERQLLSKRDLSVSFLRSLIAEAHAAAGQPSPLDEAGQADAKEQKSDRYSLDFLQGRQFAISLFREADWFVDVEIPPFRAAYHPDFQWQVKGVGGLCELTEEDLQGTHELYFAGPPAHLHPFAAFLREHHASEAKCTFPLPFLLDCVPAGIDKGRALEEVCGRLGISPSDVAAFGDGMNDEAMLRAAGHPFVMSNANPALKAALPHAPVIGSNSEAAVVRQLEALLF
ncbi:haloacid dehalogenase-like hydrolase [Strigomonas culicis]|uniref:Haloacid dehalogenase-like hydrolase n=1 Tax=Strigomonas culicis TaxID=28005 RepID=S9TS84_9TRYP|nr:haloacid dehalogenase-like hydrolase [Strigomonas culicis]EPY19439.1 haloacid dehalogenase-like hydrolase [Strigomonas culicis]|eukprot:EPY19243.1 haloacid dehalogenase-like hydrolase [Strigomonas culicis]